MHQFSDSVRFGTGSQLHAHDGDFEVFAHRRRIAIQERWYAYPIEGESYRLKEAKARAVLKAEQRRAARPKPGKS